MTLPPSDWREVTIKDGESITISEANAKANEKPKKAKKPKKPAKPTKKK